MRITLSERDMDDIDLDALRTLLESAPPATAVVCRSLEEAEALSIWIEKFEASDARLK